MKFILIIHFTITFLLSTMSGQSPIGIWKNLDDTDGKEKSHIEIYEKDGKLRAKVIKLLPAATITHCSACKGEKKNRSLVGMDILWDMEKADNIWTNGSILDPKKGKVYNCNLEKDGEDRLKVRGYVGLPTFGRTQIWYRVK